MHYYTFHIGDYMSHTRHLTPMEDLVYRRLIDLYYLHEQALNTCSTDVARDIGLSDFVQEVDYILTKFFSKEGEKWVNKRVEEEIEAYKRKKLIRSKAGIASGKARRNKKIGTHVQQKMNTCSTSVEQKADFVELTNNQEPLTNNHNNKKTIFANAQIQKKDSKSIHKKIDLENLPPEISSATAIEFIDSRAAMKKPMTQSIFDRQMASAVKIGEDESNEYTADKVVLTAVDHAWQGIKPEYYKPKKGENSYGKQELDMYDWGDGKSLRHR